MRLQGPWAHSVYDKTINYFANLHPAGSVPFSGSQVDVICVLRHFHRAAILSLAAQSIAGNSP